MKQTHRRALTLIFVALATVAVVHGPQMIRAQDSTPATGASPVGEANLIATGEKIYNSVCIACHQPGGKGVEGIYPALAGDPLVTLDDPGPMVRTLLTGRGGMPIFGGIYDNEQIAAAVSYVRTSFGNDASAVTPEFVQQMRDDLAATPLPATEATPGGVSGQHPESPAGTPTP
jgi:cytochrome c6